jgi:hypothetical protein
MDHKAHLHTATGVRRLRRFIIRKPKPTGSFMSAWTLMRLEDHHPPETSPECTPWTRNRDNLKFASTSFFR